MHHISSSTIKQACFKLISTVASKPIRNLSEYDKMMEHNIISDIIGHPWKRAIDVYHSNHSTGTMGSHTAVEPFVQCWHPSAVFAVHCTM
jgi:hypothetical protein